MDERTIPWLWVLPFRSCGCEVWRPYFRRCLVCVFFVVFFHCPRATFKKKTSFLKSEPAINAKETYCANTQAHCTCRACLNHPPNTWLYSLHARASTSPRNISSCILWECIVLSSSSSFCFYPPCEPPCTCVQHSAHPN